MSSLIVIGTDLCAGLIVVDLVRRGITVRWLQLVQEHDDPLPSVLPVLLLPSFGLGIPTPAMQVELLDRFTYWLTQLAVDAVERVQLTRLTIRSALPDLPAPIDISGVLNARALETLLRDVAATKGVIPESIIPSDISWSEEDTGQLLVGGVSVDADAVIQAENIRVESLWHLPGIASGVLHDQGLAVPTSGTPAFWTWVYTLDEAVYVDGDPSVLAPPVLPQSERATRLVPGLRGWSPMGSAITTIAPGYVRVMVVGGSGLLNAPLVVPQILAVLGITAPQQTATDENDTHHR